ncbi:MAG: hypothetical protein ACLGI3_01995, partial [Actinomycetes bacterium]
YLVLSCFALALLAPAAVSAVPSRWRAGAVAVICTPLLFSATANVREVSRHLSCGARCTPVGVMTRAGTDQVLADALRSFGVQKLFAPYWRSHIIAYRSGGAMAPVPVDCTDQRVVGRRWLITEATYEAPTTASHVLFEDGTVAGCSPAAVEQQLGPPVRVDVIGAFELWAYEGDLSQRMGSVLR